MRRLIQIVAGALLGSIVATGPAWATGAKTERTLSLRAGPGSQYERIVAIPAGTWVDVKGCQGGWCGLIWKGHRGYAAQRGLAFESAALLEPEVWPIFPPYPYRAGHYPKADWYYDMPPYTAISPGFYRKRFLLTRQERNRYRYMPHIFSGSGGYADSGPIQNVDLQGISLDVQLP